MSAFNSSLVLLLFVSLAVHAASPGIQCLDKNGKPIVYYVGLKLPNGYQYATRYSDGPFAISGSLNDATGPVGNTLK
jgi:hypothetical protein